MQNARFVPCYVNSRLTARGIAVSCEVDIYGALSEYIGTCISQDVVTLLAATEEMSTKHANRPIITMSMGGLGLVSRLSGETFGSALTFGAAKAASAPGQISVDKLATILEVMHESR